ncbi:hypothetical protein SNE25_20085 [Mucilaginibacter sabulilitoris]|uniref:Uncharacterized protein n=1 Tax=Mucilaginibacter sabulilitoris TaxID=1173583 RepID=A0ABZ0TEJ8_9SPHI|nr:hypothetical protein [Mucilaginibacter sabulilitoris]WPU91620.1 hypothetical protein SNE25_20085 [Mucilaginibacter sabulilitoris]
MTFGDHFHGIKFTNDLIGFFVNGGLIRLPVRRSPCRIDPRSGYVRCFLFQPVRLGMNTIGNQRGMFYGMIVIRQG